MIRTSSGAIFNIPIVLIPDTLTLINELKQIGFTLSWCRYEWKRYTAPIQFGSRGGFGNG